LAISTLAIERGRTVKTVRLIHHSVLYNEKQRKIQELRLDSQYGFFTSDYNELAARIPNMSTALANGQTAWLPFYAGGVSSLT